MQECNVCKETKHLSEFIKDKYRKRGVVSTCKVCSAKERKVAWLSFKEKRKQEWVDQPELREQYLEYHRNRYSKDKKVLREKNKNYYSIPKNRVRALLLSAKSRAKLLNIEYNITLDDIVIPTHCKYLGVELTTFVGKGRIPTNMSIDRIDPTKGYIKDNVQIISYKANVMKQNASQEELVTFAKNILKDFT